MKKVWFIGSGIKCGTIITLASPPFMEPVAMSGFPTPAVIRSTNDPNKMAAI
jgi:hypothetical protein